MTTDGEQVSRAELIARAWELSTQHGMSTRAVAKEMGIPHATAAGYIRIGGEHSKWIDILDRAEMQQTLALQGMKILRRITDAIDAAEDEDLAKLAPVWFKGSAQLAQLLGLNAPTRVETTNRSESSVSVNPEIAAAVREAQRRAAAELEQIRNEEDTEQ